MTDSELKAAVERRKLHLEAIDKISIGVEYSPYWDGKQIEFNLLHIDMGRLADAYLSLIAADAEREKERALPIDETWMMSIGGKVTSDGLIEFMSETGLAKYSIQCWQGHLCEWWYVALHRITVSDCDKIALPAIQDRKQFRDLLAALGVSKGGVT